MRVRSQYDDPGIPRTLEQKPSAHVAGDTVGATVGADVADVGVPVGAPVGVRDGAFVGGRDGAPVGVAVGVAVGAAHSHCVGVVSVAGVLVSVHSRTPFAIPIATLWHAVPPRPMQNWS